MSVMASTFLGSGVIPDAETECPRKVTVGTAKTHLSLLIERPAWDNLWNTVRTWETWASCREVAKKLK